MLFILRQLFCKRTNIESKFILTEKNIHIKVVLTPALMVLITALVVL